MPSLPLTIAVPGVDGEHSSPQQHRVSTLSIERAIRNIRPVQGSICEIPYVISHRTKQVDRRAKRQCERRVITMKILARTTPAPYHRRLNS